MKGKHYIDGQWEEGLGEPFFSNNLATHEVFWEGREATKEEVDAAVWAAHKSFPSWCRLSFQERAHYLETFEEKLKKNESEFAEIISKESGKPLWESHQEVTSMVQKIGISLAASQERCPEKNISLGKATLEVRHKPHGVAAVFGPFNFPGHLPNGHIVPALLAGNTIVFKGSEHTPGVSEKMASFWEELPQGVFNLVQGGPLTGHHLMAHQHVDALFFTGSYQTGMAILDLLNNQPQKIAALEMGGNNPLFINDISDLETAAYLTIHSAFLTSGQRCTCARRLILPTGKEGDEFLKVLVHMAASVQVGPYNSIPEPFMGPVISSESAEKLLTTQAMLGAQGGVSLVEMRPLSDKISFLSVGIMDVTDVSHRKDEELFGPFLQVIRVPSFEAAIEEANQTAYGLVASIFTRSEAKFVQFHQQVRAGVINWNMPTTGASSKAPFGGIGHSGNHRPSGYYAADYCAYPVASMKCKEIFMPKNLTPGIIVDSAQNFT